MANTYVDYTATAAQVDSSDPAYGFLFAFPYLEDSHVVVEVDGVVLSSSNYTIQTTPDKRVKPTSGVTTGQVVRVRRDSNADGSNPFVDFTNGSVLTEDELDKSYLHNLYLNEEIGELNEASLQKAVGGTQWDAKNLRILNVADPTGLQDAATKTYTDGQISANIHGLGTAPVKQTFTGDASETEFTFSTDITLGDDTAYEVAIDGVLQEPTTAYAINATTNKITFTSPPPNTSKVVIIPRGHTQPIGAGSTVAGNVAVTGNVSATGNVTATGNVVASGNVTSVDVTASGDVAVGDDLTVTDDASVGGNLAVTGNTTSVDVTASGDISVGDDLTVTDDASVGGDLAVTGKLTTTGNVGVGTGTPASPLHVEGNAQANKSTIAASQAVVLKASSSSRAANFGLYGVASENGVGFINWHSADGTAHRLWQDNTGKLRTSTSDSDIGTTGGTLIGAVQKYASGYATSHGSVTVANGSTHTITHNLNSTNVTVKIYVSTASDGSIPQEVTGMSTGGGSSWGAVVTNLAANTCTVQLGAHGYLDVDASGNASVVSFASKYINVVVIG